MSKRPGLGSISTRTREEAREAAGRIAPDEDTAGSQDNTISSTARANGTSSTSPDLAADAAAATMEDIEPDDAGDDEPSDDDVSEPAPSQVKGLKRAPAGGQSRGRTRRGAVPNSLTPSRVSLQRVQIGPRIKPAIKAQFDDYVLDLRNTGVTQSDVVESALVEYMERYPAEELRAALLEGH